MLWALWLGSQAYTTSSVFHRLSQLPKPLVIEIVPVSSPRPSRLLCQYFPPLHHSLAGSFKCLSRIRSNFYFPIEVIILSELKKTQTLNPNTTAFRVTLILRTDVWWFFLFLLVLEPIEHWCARDVRVHLTEFLLISPWGDNIEDHRIVHSAHLLTPQIWKFFVREIMRCNPPSSHHKFYHRQKLSFLFYPPSININNKKS